MNLAGHLQVTLPSLATKFFLILVLMLSACATEKDKQGLSKYTFENPESYLVDAKDFHRYRVTYSIATPPLVSVKGTVIQEPRAGIKTTDVWKVTHVYQGYLYIFSTEYRTRQAELIKRSYSWSVPANYYLDHLIIEDSGKVIGWISFKNPENVLLPADRRVVMDPEYWKNPQWESLPRFGISDN
jgi:hypothetical protein